MTEFAQVLANRKATLRRSSAALAAHRYGLSDFTILTIGDSTTRGVNSVGGSAALPNAWPLQFASMLNSVDGYNVDRQNLFGSGGMTQAQLVAADSRVAMTGSWASSTITLGGRMLTATAAASLAFTPADNFDKIDVYFTQSSGKGTVNINLDGGANTLVNCNNATIALSKSTLTAGAVGAHTLNVAWASGTVDFVAAIAYNSTRKGVRVLNAGHSGAQTAQITTGTSPWDAITFAKALQPDLIWYNMGINDARFATAAQFETNIRTHLDMLTPTIDVVLETLGPDGDTTGYPSMPPIHAEINTIIKTVGRTYGLLVCDLETLAGTVEQADALAFLNNDKVHPTFKFSAFRAKVVHDFLNLG